MTVAALMRSDSTASPLSDRACHGIASYLIHLFGASSHRRGCGHVAVTRAFRGALVLAWSEPGRERWSRMPHSRSPRQRVRRGQLVVLVSIFGPQGNASTLVGPAEKYKKRAAWMLRTHEKEGTIAATQRQKTNSGGSVAGLSSAALLGWPAFVASRDYERLAQTLAGLHLLAFAMLLLHRFVQLMTHWL